MLPRGWVEAQSQESVDPPSVSMAPAHRAGSSGRTVSGTAEAAILEPTDPVLQDEAVAEAARRGDAAATRADGGNTRLGW